MSWRRSPSFIKEMRATTKKKHKITNILLTRRNEDTFRHGRFFLSLPETNAPVLMLMDGRKYVHRSF